MTIDIISKFKKWLIANGQSDNTVSSYTINATKFISFLNGAEISEDKIIDYIIVLKKQYTPKTVNCHNDAIRALLRFLKLNIITPKQTKLVKKIPKYITLNFLEDSLIPMVEVVSERPFRDKVLLYFMFFTGLRKREILGLKRENFNLEERTVKLYISKTKEERILFYTKKVRNLLADYFSIEPEKNNAFNIKESTISNLLRKLNPYFKDVHLYCHLFRDSYAVHLIKQGVDISIVSELLGHHSLQSTMRYTRLKTEDLKNKYDKFIK